jgi:hypothetical protein
MLFLVQSAAVYGIDAFSLTSKSICSRSKAKPIRAAVLIVGLPDTAIRESRERIRAAIHQQLLLFSVS